MQSPGVAAPGGGLAGGGCGPGPATSAAAAAPPPGPVPVTVHPSFAAAAVAHSLATMSLASQPTSHPSPHPSEAEEKKDESMPAASGDPTDTAREDTGAVSELAAAAAAAAVRGPDPGASDDALHHHLDQQQPKQPKQQEEQLEMVTYIFKTPRGRTALARVARTAPYDVFVRTLLEAAAKRDEYGVTKSVGTAGAAVIANPRRSASCPAPSTAYSSSSVGIQGAGAGVPKAVYGAGAQGVGADMSGAVMQKCFATRAAKRSSQTLSTTTTASTTSSSSSSSCSNDSFRSTGSSGSSGADGDGSGRNIMSRRDSSTDGNGSAGGSINKKGRSVTPDLDVVMSDDDASSGRLGLDATINGNDIQEQEQQKQEPTTRRRVRRKSSILSSSSSYYSAASSSRSNTPAEVVASSSSSSSTTSMPNAAPTSATAAAAPVAGTAAAAASGAPPPPPVHQVTPSLSPMTAPSTTTVDINVASAYFVQNGNGRSFGRQEYEEMQQSNAETAPTKPSSSSPTSSLSFSSSSSRRLPQPPKEVHLTLRLRLLGGMADRQNRVGSKFGGGGVSSAPNAERDRKERLRQLALESVDLAKDPYLMRNHLGSYECKLCLTLHTNEANYLAHTQGKKHQAGLAKRAAMEKKRAREEGAAGTGPMPMTSQTGGGSNKLRQRQARVKIGRPGYEITKSRDPKTNQRCLTFYLHYPEVDDPQAVQPRHRFMSAYEQRVESPPDRRYQYLLVACEPYETVGFKVPNEAIDRGEGRFVTNWDREGKRFTLSFYFVDSEDGKKKGGTVATAAGGNLEPAAATTGQLAS